MEVMAAIMLLAIVLTTLMDLRNKAVGRAADGRNLAVATRLSGTMMHAIQAGMVRDVYDGMAGDFSDQEYPYFTYLIGVGDSSLVNDSSDMDTDSPEYVWRQALEQREEDREEEEGTDIKPEKTRVILIVTYPSSTDEPLEYRLETMLDTWAVEQDFEMYNAIWGSNNETAKIE
jgi:hypothetical protein